MNFDPTDNIKIEGDIVYHESAGGFLFFNEEGKLYVALVKKKDSGYFIPKGHVKHDEKPEEAAVREIKEELGISENFSLLSKVEIVNFEFKLPDDERLHKKKVHLFIFEIKNKVELISEGGDFGQPKWLTIDEARKLMVFDHKSLDKAVTLFNNFKK